MIEVRDLTKDYGSLRAIDHLNFKVNRGEVVGFLGPNGAGKSTAMKIITGFMAPTSGSSSVAGYDVFVEPIEVKRRIGYLPEIPPVYGDMYVRDYLRYVALLKGVEKKKLKSQIDLAIEKSNLQDVSQRLIQNLSKGYKQRVGIAQALVSDPEVLILDEPTVGLDPRQVTEIRTLIKELRGQHTLILSTHILSEVQATCERIIIINKGKIVAEDSLEGLSHTMQGKTSVHLKVRRPSDSFSKSLETISGVRKITLEEDGYHIETAIDDDILERIAAHSVSQGVGLLEMQAAKLNLEDIFLELTTTSDSPREVLK